MAPFLSMLFSLQELIQIFFFPSFVFLMHGFLGLVVHIYEFWPQFDIVMHTAGGVSIGFGAWIAFRILLRRGFLQNTPLLLIIFFLIAVVALAALLWEFAELAGDQLFGTVLFPRPLQENLGDTMADLACGLFGGILVGGYAFFSERRRRKVE